MPSLDLPQPSPLAFVASLLLAVCITLFILLGIGSVTNIFAAREEVKQLRTQAIERGFATITDDGKFRWRNK